MKLRLPRGGVASQVFVAIGGAILICQLAAALIVLTLRPAPPVWYSVDVLSRDIERVVTAMESAPVEDRAQMARGAQAEGLAEELEVRWNPADPEAVDDRRFPSLDGLATQVEHRLQLAPGAVHVSALLRGFRGGGSGGGGGPGAQRDRPPRPPPGDRSLNDERRHHLGANATVPGSFLLSVPLKTGGWITIEASDDREWTQWVQRIVLWFVVVGLVAVLVSVSVARRVLAPIQVFAAAAERLGKDPNAEPLPVQGPPEIRVAIQAFNEMQDRLRRFVHDRTTMLAAISHDLRTVMMRLRFRSAMLEESELQTKMQADLDEMDGMLLTSISFARDANAREPRHALNLAATVLAVCDDLSDQGHQVTYIGPDQATFHGQPLGLKRVLMNLTDNAVKYGGAVTATLTDHGDRLVIEVADQGAGIPEHERERVFQPFTRLESSRNRETGGIGLGLAVARGIVRAHGGEITVTDNLPHGTRMVVELPR